MLYYIIRLDDACPNMDAYKWNQMEVMLDRNNIKPIVGIIPDSKDSDFVWPTIKDFWSNVVNRYQDKGWVIGQHGCHHTFKGLTNSEFKGLSYKKQLNLIKTGNNIMRRYDIVPEVFFAPKHSFDDITVDACRDSGLFNFISDGYALFPFCYRGMLFYPSLFDSANAIFPYGIFTFVYHPSQMDDSAFIRLENFILKHRKRFVDIKEIEIIVNPNRERNIVDQTLGLIIKTIRKYRNRHMATKCVSDYRDQL